jgi:hypothetical protein
MNKSDFSTMRFLRFDNLPSTICVGITRFFVGSYINGIFKFLYAGFMFNLTFGLNPAFTRSFNMVSRNHISGGIDNGLVV